MKTFINISIALSFFIMLGLTGYADPTVEIYAKGRTGTKSDPMKADAWASFSCRIDGIECQNYGPIFFWKTEPALVFKFTDTADPIFKLPSYWFNATSFQVNLSIESGPAKGEYTKSFWAKVLDDNDDGKSGGGDSGGGSDPNDPPKNVAIDYQVIGQTISLSGSASDPDGDSLSWAWYASTASGQKGTWFSSKQNTSYGTKLKDQWFTLEVSDDVNSAVSQKVKVEAGAGGSGSVGGDDGGSDPGPNSPPLVSLVVAKPQVGIGERIVLDGSGSSDPNQDDLTYTWTSENPLFTFEFDSETDSDSVEKSNKVSVVAPEITEDTTLSFSLVVSDGEFESSPATVEVVVQTNRVPEISSVVTSVDPDFKAWSGQTVSLTVHATDPDGDDDDLEYEWSWLSDLSPELDVDSNKASFEAPSIENETEVVLQVQVSDGQAWVSRTLAVAVFPRKANSLTFPASVKTGSDLLSDSFVGVAVFNPNPSDDPAVNISASDESGQSSVVMQEALSPKGQLAFVTDQLGAGNEGQTLKVEGSSGPLQGFFMMGDSQLKRLDGIGGKLLADTKLYFPKVHHQESETTAVFVFNPSLEESAEVTLKLMDPAGQEITRAVKVIAPSGSLSGTVDQLFPEVTEVEEGYLLAVSDIPVRGFELLASENDFSSIAGQVVKQTTELLVPHFFIAKGGVTDLRILNTDTQVATSARLVAYDDQSNEIGSAEFTVKAGQLFTEPLTDLLGIDASSLADSEILTGYLRLEFTGQKLGLFVRSPEVLGSVTFSTNLGQTLSTLPMLTAGASELLFPHVAQSAEMNVFNGFAILNTGQSAATVNIEAFDAEGNPTASKALSLAAGNRIVDLLDGPALFGSGFQQVGGHVRISSDEPVVVFSLFGDFDLTYLSAVEGQEPEGF